MITGVLDICLEKFIIHCILKTERNALMEVKCKGALSCHHQFKVLNLLKVPIFSHTGMIQKVSDKRFGHHVRKLNSTKLNTE